LLWLSISVAVLEYQPHVASAEEPARRVIELNWQAVEAYNKLEIEQATATLRKALRYAKSKNVTGSTLARTYLIMGIVAVGGSGNANKGREHFLEALRIDPSINLDPLLATPEIQATFDDARKQVKDDSPAAQPEEGLEGTALIHRPVEEQTTHTAVPVYVEAPEGLPVSHVYVYYQRSSQSGFAKAEMQRIEDGWGYEIPCQEVSEPSMEYYIVAVDSRGSKLAQLGSTRNPISVVVVSQPLTSPPSLPGRSPPETCDQECAPGDFSCNNNKAGLGLEGDKCQAAGDCAANLMCVEGTCSKESLDEKVEKAPRFFFQLGPAVGLAYVTSGMIADQIPPEDNTKKQAWVQDNESGEDDCSDDDANKTTYCVKIEKPGFVPTLALKATFGYYVSPRIALAGFVRFQPDAGFGQLSHYLFGLRLQYLLNTPSARGWWGAVHVGGTIGQIQPHPAQPANLGRPYVTSGLQGVVGGGTVGMRLFRNLGFYLSPEINFLFPTTMLNIDTTAGIEISF